MGALTTLDTWQSVFLSKYFSAICARDDLTLVLVTLREKTGCQQTITTRCDVIFIQLSDYGRTRPETFAINSVCNLTLSYYYLQLLNYDLRYF